MSSISRLKGFLAVDPANPELLCELVDALFAEGGFSEARQILRDAPESARATAGVRFREARLHLVHGDYADSEAVLTRLLNEHPGNDALIHDIAFAQLCQRRTEDARQTLALAQAGDANDASAQNPELGVLAARIAMMDGDFEQTQVLLAQVLAREPEHSTALGLRALAWLDAGDGERAALAAAQCLALHPDQHEALLCAGSLALWQHDPELAEPHFSRALQRFPNSGRALSGLGQVHMLRGELAPANEVLERAVVAMPDHIGTWHALGWIQLLEGDLDAAGRSYQSAYDLDRNFAESHGGLAVVALLNGRVEEGEASMKRALKLDPNSVSGRYARTLWLNQAGDDDAANGLFAQLLAEGVLPGVTNEQAGQMAERLKARALARRPS